MFVVLQEDETSFEGLQPCDEISWLTDVEVGDRLSLELVSGVLILTSSYKLWQSRKKCWPIIQIHSIKINPCLKIISRRLDNRV